MKGCARPGAIADEFGAQLFEELDYETEAANCRRFGQLYGGVPGILVPSVDERLTTPRVLVQEWVDGEKGPWAEGGDAMLAIGLQCSVLQVLDSGFFHADPHRGNLLRTPDGRLAYLDFGMMAQVPADARLGLVGAALGLQNRDLALIAESLVSLGFLPEETELGALVPALEAAFRDATRERAAAAAAPTPPAPSSTAMASRADACAPRAEAGAPPRSPTRPSSSTAAAARRAFEGPAQLHAAQREPQRALRRPRGAHPAVRRS